MMCFGLSTMLLGKVAAAMFEMEAFGWRKTFFFVGAIIAVILVICALFLKKPGADVVFQTTPAKAGKSKTKTAGSATNKVADSAYVKASATQSSSAKPISQRDYTAAETMRLSLIHISASVAAAVLYILCFIHPFLLFLPHIVTIPYLHHYAMLWSNPVYCNIFLIYLKGRRSGSYFFHKIVKIDFSTMGVYNDHNRLLSDFEGKN